MKDKILIGVGILGGGVSYMVGGWTESLSTLFILMLCDYITGFILSAIFRNSPKTETGGLSSKIGFIGLCKKCLIFVWVIVGYRLDLTLGTDYIKYGVIYAFMINEIVSLVENSTLLGFPTPKIITDSIDLIKSKQK